MGRRVDSMLRSVIAPDMKDWMWVLDRTGACGSDASTRAVKSGHLPDPRERASLGEMLTEGAIRPGRIEVATALPSRSPPSPAT